MNFIEQIFLRLHYGNMKTISKIEVAASMGMSVQVFDARLQQAGWSWLRLLDHERQMRYLKAKTEYPEMPGYKLAQQIQCASSLLYRQRDRWEKHNNLQR
jgi:hypothetical protein